MKLKSFGILLALLSLVVLVVGCQPQFQAGNFTDDMGREVYIAESPQRIVSHVPPITETLFALGLEERIVGVSDYCDYPEAAKAKPSIGDYFNPAIENILALNPDLVLTDGHSQNIQQLDELNPPVAYMVIDPEDIDGILADIELLGQVTGTEARATELVSEMRADIDRVVNQVADAPKVRVLYIIDATDLNNPWTAGQGSLVDSLITMAGGENIAAQTQGAWVQLSLEAVLAADPEVIILPSQHGTVFTSPEVLQAHPVWREVLAVKQDRVYIIEADTIEGYGPRIVQGLEAMAAVIHPELFE